MLSTAVEIFMRQQEAERSLAPMHDAIEQMTRDLFGQVLDHRLPLIRYGRRKRRYRRMFPADIAAMHIAFDGADVRAAPVSKRTFYR